MTAAEIAETLGLALSTVSRWLKRIGLGKARSIRPSPPTLRAPPPGRARARRHQAARADQRACAGHRMLGHRKSQFNRRVEGRVKRLTGFEYVHVMVDDHSRLAYAEVLGDLDGEGRDRLPQAGMSVVRRSRHADRAGDDRQRSCLQSACSRCCMPQARVAPDTYSSSQAPHERQGRALHPDARERVGLRPHLWISAERSAGLPLWLDHYNFRRPHGSLGHRCSGY